MRLKVILDLNLATGTPLLARNWVREAEAVLPAGSILGFEIGNEPDLYNRAFWRRLALASEPFGRRVLAPNLGPSRYVTDFRLYARAVSSVAPRAALFGPAISNAGAGLPWVRALLDGPHPGLRVVTAHRYPYARCVFARIALVPDDRPHPERGGDAWHGTVGSSRCRPREGRAVAVPAH